MGVPAGATGAATISLSNMASLRQVSAEKTCFCKLVRIVTLMGEDFKLACGVSNDLSLVTVGPLSFEL